MLDDRADSKQRTALSDLLHGKIGGPWSIFASLVSKWLDTLFVRYDVKIDGLKSRVKAGDTLELELSKIPNPVTGDPE